MSVMGVLTLTQREQGRLQTLNLVREGRMGVAEAAVVLGLSERHTWRILAAYRREGVAALSHGNRGCHPANALPEETRQRVITLASTQYSRINHTHLIELLAEREALFLSRSTVRNILVGAGLSSPRRRRPPRHRCRRERMPQEGMLIQVDGSHHGWLEDRGPWFTLLLAVDDATGKVPYGIFREKEDTQGYLLLLKGIIERRGIPLALYSDRYIVFRQPSKLSETVEAALANNGKPTQFGRAMKELGVTQVFASSPEAKGRVERANGTFQDRLVSELRLAGASTLEEANNVLEQFLPRFNERFGVPPAQPESAYRPIDPGLNIDAVLCNKEMRRVARDNTVQYHGQTLQLFPGTDRPSYSGSHVEVQERLDGQLLVNCCGKLLTPMEAPPLAATLRAVAVTDPMNSYLAMQADIDISDRISRERAKATKRYFGLGWDGDWYHNDSKKCIHRDLVKAGMERARQQGKRIGRPKVTERPEFLQRFASVVESIGPTGLSRRQAAKKLAIGYATLKRLLDARLTNAGQWAGNGDPPADQKGCGNPNMYAEVPY
jgi:transposase